MRIVGTQGDQADVQESAAPPLAGSHTFYNAIPQRAHLRAGDHSTVFRRRTPTQSELLWGSDFVSDLPHFLGGPTTIEVMRGDWERATHFLRRFPVLAEDLAQTDSRARQVKQHYLRTFCDLIECRNNGNTVGVFIGAPEDWSTYYCRVLAFDPAFGARPLMRRFARECLERPLRQLGVARLVGETGTTNTAMSRWFIDLGFHISGQRLTERWGPMTHFTKFLDQSCSEMFAHRYTQGRGDCHISEQSTGGKGR